ncbi:MAG TPA: trypsin-like peptidase domain-containing protein [Ignavibacteria bacterium]|nr:trypsin-like peptidase domain-containing protein [Ignavibacteria bacterium]
MKKIILSLIFLLVTGKSFAQDLTSEQIFDLYKDAVVVINAYGFDGTKSGSGSAVIVKDKNLIVTNFHILSGNEKIEIITHKDTLKDPEIIGVDIDRDVLLLKLPHTDYQAIQVGNSDDVKPGQKIYAIGNPMGLENTISEGLVSGIRDSVTDIKMKFIQISASLSPGSSGGAVINSKGELIGISSMGMKEGQNLNFAIPINEVFDIHQTTYTDKKKLEALNFFLQAQENLEQGKNKEAIEFLEKYLKEFPDDHKGYNYRGLAYTGRKMYKEALADFNKSIKINAKYAPAYTNRADIYFKTEDFEKAIKDYSSIIKMFPDNIYAYYARGIARMSNEDNSEAAEDFTFVIKKDKHYTAAYLNRGIAYYKDHQWELAIVDFKTAISINPGLRDDLQPLIDQADILWQAGVK